MISTMSMDNFKMGGKYIFRKSKWYMNIYVQNQYFRNPCMSVDFNDIATGSD